MSCRGLPLQKYQGHCAIWNEHYTKYSAKDQRLPVEWKNSTQIRFGTKYRNDTYRYLRYILVIILSLSIFIILINLRRSIYKDNNPSNLG